MPEAVGAVAGVDQQHLGRDGLAQAGQQLRLVGAGHLGQQLVLDPAPGGRGHGQHPLGRLAQRLDAREQHVPEARGQLAVAGGRGGQLLGEEGVAPGARVDPLGQPGRRWRAQDPGEQVGHLGRAEPGQLQPLDPPAAVQLGQERPQGMAPVQLVAAVGHHQQQPAVAQVADQEAEQVAGGAVGPVQALHHQHGRAVGAQAVQQAEQQLEQPP